MFKDYFENVLGVSSENIVYLPQYAEELFDEVLSATIGKDRYDFVFAGNIGEMQSVETIIKAVKLLNGEKFDKEIKIHIVGEGSKLKECQKLAAGLSNIEFYGRRPVGDMPEFYGMADAMLLTLKSNKTISYTLPGKVQSYLAAGKPIIGAVNGEARRVIEEAECGYCCEAEDSEALAEQMKKFVESEQKQQMGIRAREYYKQHFLKSTFIAQLEQLLEKNKK